MSKILKAILIDPNKREIKDYQQIDNLDDYYETLNCMLIEVIHTEINDKPVVLIVDEEGWFDKNDLVIGSIINGGFVAGKILILGYEGENFIDTPVTVEEVEDVTAWARAKTIDKEVSNA